MYLPRNLSEAPALRQKIFSKNLTRRDGSERTLAAGKPQTSRKLWCVQKSETSNYQAIIDKTGEMCQQQPLFRQNKVVNHDERSNDPRSDVINLKKMCTRLEPGVTRGFCSSAARTNCRRNNPLRYRCLSLWDLEPRIP